MKIIEFVREDGDIKVQYQSTLVDAGNLDENFSISYPKNVDTYLKNKLFYHFDTKKWTLSEMIFFAKNNRMCIFIYNEYNQVVADYGNCQCSDNYFHVNVECFRINNTSLTIN